MSVEAIPYILLVGTLFGSTLLASRFGVGQFAPLTYVGCAWCWPEALTP